MFPITLVQPADARFTGDEPINGNQELVAHPTLNYVYYGGSSMVTVYNCQNGMTDEIPLGGDGVLVSSMDINAAGTRLVAACGDSIYLLNLTNGLPTLNATVNSVGGAVRSVCYGQGDVIYATYESGSDIEAYDEEGPIPDSKILTELTEACILETNKARTVLIAATLGGTETTIITYDISGGPDVPPSSQRSSTPIAGKLAQLEATDTSIYMASTGAEGIQVVSLTDLSVTTFPMGTNAVPSGVALSKDGSIVFGVSALGSSDPAGQAAIYAFDLSGNQLSTRYVDYQAAAIAPCSERLKVVTASPLRVETVGPVIEAIAPAPGSVYAYSPGFVRFSISHDPVIDAGSVNATIDSVVYTVVRMTSEAYQINLTSALPAGEHTVRVTVPWGGTNVNASWTFTSGSTSASALRPTLSLIDPAPGSIIDVSPDQIVLEVDMPAPPPYESSVTIKVNNLTLTAVADPDDPTRYAADWPNGLELEGTVNVTATATVDGIEITRSWTFTVDEGTDPEKTYSMVSYGENFSIPVPVDWSVQRDQGEWELTITGPSQDGVATKVFVDIVHDPSVRANQAYINTFAQTVLANIIDAGDPAEMVGGVSYSAISNLTAGVWKIRLTEQGVQEAYALIVDEVNGDRWLIKCSASDTSFIDLWPIFDHMIRGVEIEAQGTTPVDIPPSAQGYAFYRMRGDYQLVIPDNWTIKREVAAGGTTVSLKLTGPKVGDLHVTILLQNGTDASVQDDRAYLLSLVQAKFLPELEARGIDATVYEQPRILSISDHTALVFSIKWTDLQNSMSVVQAIYFIVDEGDHCYWMFTCESPEEAYPFYVQIFDKVAQSFTPLGSSSTPTTSGGLLSDPTTVLMIAVLAVTGVAAVVVFLVAQRYRPRT